MKNFGLFRSKKCYACIEVVSRMISCLSCRHENTQHLCEHEMRGSGNGKEGEGREGKVLMRLAECNFISREVE